MIDRKPKYPRLKQMQGTDKRLCNGPVRLSVIGCSSTALCHSGRPKLSQTNTLWVNLRRLLRTMSAEQRKLRTLMRLRCRLANVSAGWNNGIAKHAWRCNLGWRLFA